MSRSSSFLVLPLALVALLVALFAVGAAAAAPDGEGCAALGLKIQMGPCSSAPTGLLHAFDSPEKASAGLSSSCGDLSKLATPPPTAECCETLSEFGAAGCACDPVTLSLAQMALGVGGDGMKALIRGATAACRAVGVAVVDSCGGETC